MAARIRKIIDAISAWMRTGPSGEVSIVGAIKEHLDELRRRSA